MPDVAFPCLDALRVRLGAPPRKLGWFSEPPIAFPVPPWLASVSAQDDMCKRVFENFKPLWKNGVVVWGRIIKANTTLYEAGTNDAPGEALFSLTDDDAYAVERMPELVMRLWQLADPDMPEPTNLSPREADWRADISDGASYHEGFQLPETWQPPGHVYMASSPVFHRAHLPNGRIMSKFLPLLVNPEPPRVAMVVPVEFWPPGLAEWLATHHSVSEPKTVVDSENRGAREAIYTQRLGPIGSVFHETQSEEVHIDVYCFDWLATTRGEAMFLTGGMSDCEQPVASEMFRRVEIAFYVKEKRPEFAELLRMMGHYSGSTGQAVGPWDTFPLGDMAERILGTTRFTAVLALPALAKSERPLVEALEVEGEQVYFLTLFPLLPEELDLKLKQGDQALIDLFTKQRFDITFDPLRPSLL